MNHTIHIKKLGPINECTLEIKQFNVFTGPQSNGKSTVAKAIYYCRSIKQDILNIMMQGGPSKVFSAKTDWKGAMQARMKDKFLQIFGTSWIMPSDMMLDYVYGDEKMSLCVSLNEDYERPGHNYVNIQFSEGFLALFQELDDNVFLDPYAFKKGHWEEVLTKTFHDPYETVFIPAGRNLITILSEQMNYIFTSLEGSQLRQIDYVTKRYIETILKLKPLFGRGLSGYIDDVMASEDSEAAKKFKSNRPAIKLLCEKATEILGGSYRYVDGEERLYLDERKYIKINFTSSGQQEIIWVFNLLFYYLIEDKRVFLILEEPESHLYPSSQRSVGELLGLFLNDEKNAELITTHSPYLLGTFNYMLQAGQSKGNAAEKIKQKLRKRYWLDPKQVSASYIRGGSIEDALDQDDELTLIKNELIDQASVDINNMSDFIIDKNFEDSDNAEHQ